MKLVNQTLPESAILGGGGLILVVVASLLITDYRGLLTSYVHRCWLVYQRRWYQRTFLWAGWSRAASGDEARLRRQFLALAVIGLVMGLCLLGVEATAAATGHVL